ncbi:MAG: FliH/SctL family protein [Bacillota bacterium]
MSRVFRAQNRAPRTVQVAQSRAAAQMLANPEQVLADANRKAAEALSTAREEAASLVEAATSESESIRERASVDGYKDGFVKGHEAVFAQVSDLLTEAQSALDLATDAFAAMQKESEPRVIALALCIAKRIAADSLQSDPQVLLDLVRKGMAALKDEKEFSLRVDPHLVSILEGARDDLGREFGARSVEVVPDAAATDGALIHTPHGFVDLTIASQIRNVAVALAEARKRAVGEEQ